MRVRPVVNLEQALLRDMGVILCRRNTRVTKHLLHMPDVCAFVQQVCRHRVTQAVRGNAAIKTKPCRTLAQQVVCAAPGKRRPFEVDKQCIGLLLRAVECVSAVRQVLRNRMARCAADKDNAIFITLARYLNFIGNLCAAERLHFQRQCF